MAVGDRRAGVGERARERHRDGHRGLPACRRDLRCERARHLEREGRHLVEHMDVGDDLLDRRLEHRRGLRHASRRVRPHIEVLGAVTLERDVGELLALRREPLRDRPRAVTREESPVDLDAVLAVAGPAPGAVSGAAHGVERLERFVMCRGKAGTFPVR